MFGFLKTHKGVPILCYIFQNIVMKTAFHKAKITNTQTKTLNNKTSVSKSQTTQKKQ